MKHFHLLGLWLFMALVFHSCKPMPNDGVPFYLKIDSAQLTTFSGQGLNTHNISDVWVEVEADNLGAYEIPCNFPVLKENDVRFVINAGVMESGQSGVRVIYPFYTPDTFTINATRTQTYHHTPAFTYKAATNVVFNDDFDFGKLFQAMELCSDSNKRYGNRCGMLTVIADSAKEATYNTPHDLPEGEEIWVEFDYKSDVPFFVGYKAYYTSGGTDRVPVVFVNAKAEWSKMYVNLRNYVVQSQADTYAVYFEALRPYGSAGGRMYIDNIRLLHF